MSVNPLLGLTGGQSSNNQSSATGTNGASGTSGVTSSSAASNPASKLGESAFLTLLAAELQYQNPLQPMDNTQFVAELAQFSQLSAVTNQTNTLQQILQAVQGNSSNSLVGASQLIGKTVTTQSGGSGLVTAVTSTPSGITFDVSGVGTVQASDITQVSQS